MKYTIELLTAFERPARLPIPEQLAALMARMDAVEGADGPGEMASILNRAALMEVQFGRPDKAAALCWLQIHWVIKRVFPRYGVSQLFLVFQPWINLARLDRHARRYGAARRKLAKLHNVWSGQSACLAGLILDKDKGASVLDADAYVRSFLRNTHLTERLLLGLGSQGEESLVDAADLPGVSASVRCQSIVAEAKLLEHLLQDRNAASLELPADTNQMRVLALKIRALSVLAHRNEASAMDRMMAVTDALTDGPMDNWRLALFQNVVGFWADHDRSYCAELCEIGKMQAQGLSDCVSKAWFDTLLSSEREKALRRRILAETTWHGAIRQGTAEPRQVHQVDLCGQRLKELVAA